MNRVYFALFFLVSVMVHAHPHLFIKPALQLEATDTVLTGIRVSWEWDQWWTSDVLDGCDLNKNGALEPNEVMLVYKNFFDGIKDFDYFTIITINQKRYHIKKVDNFNAVAHDGTVTYYFTIPVTAPPEQVEAIQVVFNDETIYTAFDLKTATVTSTGGEIKNILIKPYSYYGVELSFNFIGTSQ